MRRVTPSGVPGRERCHERVRSIVGSAPASRDNTGRSRRLEPTPSLAATGRAVAAVWTATRDGAANVYLSVSHDGGSTFSHRARQRPGR